MKKFRELTKLESELMNIIWEQEEVFVNDILDALPEPKPAYNTVSTIVRILVAKGFVGYKTYGRSHQYYPIVKKEDYLNDYMNSVKRSFFDDSFTSMMSFFARKENLTKEQIDEIIDIFNKNR